MTHTERVEAVLRGAPVDRLPVSFWRHFYLAERTPQGLAQSMLYFWRRYQWDFLKVNPRATYQAEAWGTQPKYGADEHSGEELAEWPVKRTSDWASIKPVSPAARPLAEQLEALERIKRGLDGGCLFIETVSSPLSTLGMLAGGPDRVKEDIVEAPEAVHNALGAVTETLGAFVEEVLKVADGIFYATTIWAASEHLTPRLYEEFGRPYDLQVLSHAQSARLNILHVCQSHNFVRDLMDYPTHVVHWDVYAPGNPDLLDVAKLTDKVLMGGVDGARVLRVARPAEVRAHIESLIAGEKPAKFIVGAGCVVDTHTPDDNLMTVKTVLAGQEEAPA